MRLNKKTFLLALITLFVLSILIIGHISSQRQKCQNINITFVNSNKSMPNFLTKQEVLQYIYANVDEKIIGGNCAKINLNKIEQVLNKNPYISKAEVYKQTVQGNIDIKIWFRKPIVKIYTNKGTFLIDQDGYVFPLKFGRVPYTIVANGNLTFNSKKNFNKSYHLSQLVDTNKSTIYQVYKLSKYIISDKFLKNLITQIYVNDTDLELIPRVGDFTIVFGDIGEYEKKFRNLKAFFKNLDRIGWNKYSKINLSLTNQIICTKK